MPVNAYRDENNVPTLIAALSTDGRTIVRVLADPVTHRLNVTDGTTGSDHGPVNDLRDQNSIHTLMAVSSVDGQTPVVLYANNLGELLVQST